MLTILIIVLLVLALGGGGWAWNGGYAANPMAFQGGGLIGLLLLVMVIWMLLGAGTPALR